MRRLLVALSVLMLLTAGCVARGARVPSAPRPEVQAKLANLPRVWIAGFISVHVPARMTNFDFNAETVRLVRSRLRTWSSAQVIDAEPVVIDTEQRLSDVTYWRRQGEEHGWPLIVSGSVKVLLAPPKVEQRGRRTMYFPLAGRVLEATVVLIDGRSGEVLSTRRLPSRMQYGIGRFSSDAYLFLQLMDQAMPDWLGAIAGASPAAPERGSIQIKE